MKRIELKFLMAAASYSKSLGKTLIAMVEWEKLNVSLTYLHSWVDTLLVADKPFQLYIFSAGN